MQEPNVALFLEIVKKETYKCIYFINQNHKTYISYKTHNCTAQIKILGGKSGEIHKPPIPISVIRGGRGGRSAGAGGVRGAAAAAGRSAGAGAGRRRGRRVSCSW